MRLLLTAIILAFTSGSFAHSNMSGFQNFRRNTATVMFAGIGGAVVGLSTLSFYGKPEEHTGNIWAGLAAGILGGLVYVSLSDEESGEYAGLTIDAQGTPTAVYKFEF